MKAEDGSRNIEITSLAPHLANNKQLAGEFKIKIIPKEDKETKTFTAEDWKNVKLKINNKKNVKSVMYGSDGTRTQISSTQFSCEPTSYDTIWGACIDLTKLLAICKCESEEQLCYLTVPIVVIPDDINILFKLYLQLEVYGKSINEYVNVHAKSKV